MRAKRLAASAFLAVIAASFLGCVRPHVPEPAPDTQAAIGFAKSVYPGIGVEKIDERTIGVIWESGGQEQFRELQARIKQDFGVDVVITAVE